jgi:hypothetical protein
LLLFVCAFHARARSPYQAIASHPLTACLMPSLPGLAPRLARASPKIAELLLQARIALSR